MAAGLVAYFVSRTFFHLMLSYLHISYESVCEMKVHRSCYCQSRKQLCIQWVAYVQAVNGVLNLPRSVKGPHIALKQYNNNKWQLLRWPTSHLIRHAFALCVYIYRRIHLWAECRNCYCYSRQLLCTWWVAYALAIINGVWNSPGPAWDQHDYAMKVTALIKHIA